MKNIDKFIVFLINIKFMNSNKEDDTCCIDIINVNENVYQLDIDFWISIKNNNFNNLKEIITSKNFNINKIDDLKRTYLDKFLDDKKKLKFKDIRIILMLLQHNPNIDIKNNDNKTVREKLLEIGYEVDRKYLTKKESLIINEESTDVSNEGSINVTNEESDNVTNEESINVTNEEIANVTNEESTNVSNEENTDVSNEEYTFIIVEKEDDLYN